MHTVHASRVGYQIVRIRGQRIRTTNDRLQQ